MATCKNCSFEFDGKFCPQCGQKAKTKRITTKTVWEEVRKSLVHYDQGFFYTMLQLLRRPGHAVRDYLEGKRVNHMKPVKFMIWTTALNFLIFHFLGLDQAMMQTLQEKQGNNKLGMEFSRYIFDHPSLVLLLLIPNIALFSWLFFRRSGYNYAEHFVLNAFLMGEVSLIGVISNPVYKLIGYDSNPTMFYASTAVQMVVWVSYMGWGYTQFFQPRRKWTGWLKSVLALLSGYFLLIIVVSILVGLFVALFWPWIKPFVVQ